MKDAGGYRLCWHASRNLAAIRRDGIIRPIRMPCVYLFSDEIAAYEFSREFGYEGVISAFYRPEDVASVWCPFYCISGKVVRLKPGRTATTLEDNDS